MTHMRGTPIFSSSSWTAWWNWRASRPRSPGGAYTEGQTLPQPSSAGASLMQPLKRRTFLKQASLGAAAWGAYAAAGRAADRGRVVVGVIGTGGMGMHHVKRLAARKDVELAYVCDVDQQRLQNAA